MADKEDTFLTAVEKGVGPFDPNGSGYDNVIADQIISSNPSSIDKPSWKPRTPVYGASKPAFEEVANKGDFAGWVWHPEKNDWLLHKGSFHPETGRLLKGIKHPTISETFQREAKLGNEIVKRKDGYYYSQPNKK